MNRAASDRTLQTAAAFGVDSAAPLYARRERAKALRIAAGGLLTQVRPGDVVLVTGPSGAGKSTLLRLISRNCAAVTARGLTHAQERLTVAALSPRTPLRRWTGLLAAFGLAEARLLLTRAGDLSAGERARLELALAAARCERRSRGTSVGAFRVPLLVADEWCSVLDRPTAASVAIGAARWARRRGHCLVGATAHEDLVSAVQADLLVTVDEQGGARWTRCGLSRAS